MHGNLSCIQRGLIWLSWCLPWSILSDETLKYGTWFCENSYMQFLLESFPICSSVKIAKSYCIAWNGPYKCVHHILPYVSCRPDLLSMTAWLFSFWNHIFVLASCSHLLSSVIATNAIRKISPLAWNFSEYCSFASFFFWVLVNNFCASFIWSVCFWGHGLIE